LLSWVGEEDDCLPSGEVSNEVTSAATDACTQLRLGVDRRAVFLANVKNDTAWLEQHGIMDYSLLLGVGRCSNAKVVTEKLERKAKRDALQRAQQGSLHGAALAQRRPTVALVPVAALLSPTAEDSSINRSSSSGALLRGEADQTRFGAGDVAAQEEEELEYLLTRGVGALSAAETARVQFLMQRGCTPAGAPLPSGPASAAVLPPRPPAAPPSSGVQTRSARASPPPPSPEEEEIAARLAAKRTALAADGAMSSVLLESNSESSSSSSSSTHSFNSSSTHSSNSSSSGVAVADSSSDEEQDGLRGGGATRRLQNPVNYWENELGGVCACHPTTNLRMTTSANYGVFSSAVMAAPSAGRGSGSGGSAPRRSSSESKASKLLGVGGLRDTGAQSLRAVPEADRGSEAERGSEGGGGGGAIEDEGGCDESDGDAAAAAPGADGGLERATDVWNEDEDADEREWYTFGIIDILQRYDTRKKGEGVLKETILRKEGVSSVPPKRYAERFVSFLEKHTM
jgi:hypothetical protein